MLNEVLWIFLIYLIHTVSSLELSKKKHITQLLKIEKPKHDKNMYYTIELPNKLKALIITDKKSKSAGLGLTINAGGAMDKDLYGLAHFTEHMVFLGSKKFNNATYFFDYVTLHHGHINGHTQINSTTFFFTIDKYHFKHAFDIFSSVFTDPFFNSTYVEKEINAVNSEHQKNILSNRKKKMHIMKKLANQNSLFPRFTTGNNDTLFYFSKNNNINLTQRLNSYFNEYYVPNNIKIVINGPKNVEYYRKLLEKSFGSMAEKNFTKILEEEKPFEYDKQGSLVIHEGTNKKKEIEIYFIFPGNDDPAFKLYENPFHLYFKKIFNSAFKNPIFNNPKYHYFSMVKCGFTIIYSNVSFFTVKILPTDKGIKELEKLLSLIYGYIDFLKEKAINDQTQYEKFEKSLNKRFYISKKSKKAKDKLKKISSGLGSNIPFHKLLSRNKLLPKYDKKKLYDMSNFFSKNNSFIFISHNEQNCEKYRNYTNFLKNFDINNIFKEYEQYYNTKYGTFEISQLPKANINFAKIPPYTKIKIHKAKLCTTAECKTKFKKDANDLTPDIYKYKDIATLYHKLDRSFMKDSVSVYVDIGMPLNNSSPIEIAVLKLYAFFIDQRVVKKIKKFDINENIK
jgi:insulysin